MNEHTVSMNETVKSLDISPLDDLIKRAAVITVPQMANRPPSFDVKIKGMYKYIQRICFS